MHEPAPTDDIVASEPDGGDHDARVEQLLLAGLDFYFAGHYERAVHVWTRVLFLDRGHARARAYIERARAALAERHRHSDELLHRGTTAFERGHTGAARRLLTEAVEQGGATEVALAYLDRLDRLDSPSPEPPGLAPPAAGLLPPPAATTSPRRSLPWSVASGVMTVAGAGALVLFGAALAGHAPWRDASRATTAAPARATDALPTVRPSEVALARARALFDTGHPADAIGLLETISIADPHRADADRLLAEIQHALLTAASPARSAQ